MLTASTKNNTGVALFKSTNLCLNKAKKIFMKMPTILCLF